MAMQIMTPLKLHPTRWTLVLPLRRVRYPVLPECRIADEGTSTIHADKVFRLLLVNLALVSGHHRVRAKLFLANVALVTFLGVSPHVTLPGTLG